MTRRQSVIRSAALLLALASLAALLPETSGDPGDLHCLQFPDSETVYFPGYGDVCASYGGGCLSCWTECQAGQPCGGRVCGEIVGCEDYPPP